MDGVRRRDTASVIARIIAGLASMCRRSRVGCHRFDSGLRHLVSTGCRCSQEGTASATSGAGTSLSPTARAASFNANGGCRRHCYRQGTGARSIADGGTGNYQPSPIGTDSFANANGTSDFASATGYMSSANTVIGHNTTVIANGANSQSQSVIDADNNVVHRSTAPTASADTSRQQQHRRTSSATTVSGFYPRRHDYDIAAAFGSDSTA